MADLTRIAPHTKHPRVEDKIATQYQSFRDSDLQTASTIIS